MPSSHTPALVIARDTSDSRLLTPNRLLQTPTMFGAFFEPLFLSPFTCAYYCSLYNTGGQTLPHIMIQKPEGLLSYFGHHGTAFRLLRCLRLVTAMDFIVFDGSPSIVSFVILISM
jgi:hypothetical protein